MAARIASLLTMMRLFLVMAGVGVASAELFFVGSGGCDVLDHGCVDDPKNERLIGAVQVDATGALSWPQFERVDASGIPSWLVTDGDCTWAALHDTNRVASFRNDDGALALVASEPSGGKTPLYMELSPDRQLLFVANYDAPDTGTNSSGASVASFSRRDGGCGLTLDACLALGNLLTQNDNHDAVLEAGALSVLVDSMTQDDLETRFDAVFACNKMATRTDNHDVMVAGNIASAGLSAELEIQREVAACLCNVTLEPEVRLDVAKVCLPAMVHLAQCGDREAARQAMGSLANLAEDMTTHTHVAAYGGSRCMVALIDHDSVDIHREASRAIANLLTSFHHQSTIISDGLPGLVHLALGPDGECQYNAALSFRKLTPNKDAHQGIVDNGGLEALFQLLEIRDSKEVPTRRQAATALRDLAANPELKLVYAAKGGIDAMVALSKNRELSLQCLATASLRHLSLHDELKRPLVEAGALPPLVRNASRANEDLQCQVAGFLANLSEETENQISLVSNGCIPVLCTLARVENDEIQQDSARALANVTSNEEGGIQALLRLGRERTTDEELQYKAALTVGTLASNAVKMMPHTSETHGGGAAARRGRSEIGFGAAAMLQARVTQETKRGTEETLSYLDKTASQDPNASKGHH